MYGGGVDDLTGFVNPIRSMGNTNDNREAFTRVTKRRRRREKKLLKKKE